MPHRSFISGELGGGAGTAGQSFSSRSNFSGDAVIQRINAFYNILGCFHYGGEDELRYLKLLDLPGKTLYKCFTISDT